MTTKIQQITISSVKDKAEAQKCTQIASQEQALNYCSEKKTPSLAIVYTLAPAIINPLLQEKRNHDHNSTIYVLKRRTKTQTPTTFLSLL
jgi:hypothetical protein